MAFFIALGGSLAGVTLLLLYQFKSLALEAEGPALEAPADAASDDQKTLRAA